MPVRSAAASRRRPETMRNAVNRSLRNMFAKRKQHIPEQGPMGPVFPRTPQKKAGKRSHNSSLGPVDSHGIDSDGLLNSGRSECSDSGELNKMIRTQDPLSKPIDDSDRDGEDLTNPSEHYPLQGSESIRPGIQVSGRREEMSKRTLSNLSDRFMENVYYMKESRTVGRLNNVRQRIGDRVNDNRVQWFIVVLIMVNAIMIGIATFPTVKDNPEAKSTFELIDRVFLIIFTIEATMQLTYHGCALFKDAWLVFDLSIVAISWAFDKIQVARAFRIFRALRLIARIDVMKNLIKALIGVIPNVTAIAMLLTLVFYIFGVMFTQLYKDVSKQYPREEQYFVALPDTLFTLFQIMTMDEWSRVYIQAYDAYWWSWILFISFVVVSAFIFANLIIAVICDGVRVMEDDEVAGLTGYEEDEIYHHRVVDGSEKDSDRPWMYPRTTTMQKLREMEQQLDQIVMTQNQLRNAITIIAQSYHLNGSMEENGSGLDENINFGELQVLAKASLLEIALSEEDYDSGEESMSSQQSSLPNFRTADDTSSI
ncbi:hypothetical protein ACHAXN_007915 [Cyclotella atomus]